MIAYSCLLMFFIGAPLGAIIRKGGIGLPIVFAIIIFIAFHFINTFGRKLAQEDSAARERVGRGRGISYHFV